MSADRRLRRRVLAIFPIDLNRQDTVGLRDKAHELIIAAKSLGLEVDACFAKARQLVLWKHEDSPPWREWVADGAGGVRDTLYQHLGFYQDVTKLLGTGAYTHVWARAAPVTPLQVRMWRTAKKRGLATLLDVPSYPFAYEADSWLRRIVLSATHPLYKLQAASLDRVGTTSQHARIWDIPTLRVRNGVLIAHPVGNGAGLPPKTGKIRVAGIAQWAKWHGLHRLIEGLKDSPLKTEFEFKFAGEGPLLDELKRAAAAAGLEVKWLGSVAGETRKELLAWCDIAIGTLSWEGNRLEHYYSLKHRLYAAQGVPFVATTRDPVWHECEAVLGVKQDAGPVAAERIYHFGKRAREHAVPYAELLRARAANHAWQVTYRAVWDWLLDDSLSE